MLTDCFMTRQRFSTTDRVAASTKGLPACRRIRAYVQRIDGVRPCLSWHALVIGALVSFLVGCTPPPSPPAGWNHVTASTEDSGVTLPSQAPQMQRVVFAETSEDPASGSEATPHQLHGNPGKDRRPRVLVRPFEADARRPEDAHLGYLMVEAIGRDLSQVPSVSVVPGSVLNRMFLGRQEKLLELTGSPNAAKAQTWCREAHADLVVTGSVERSAGGVTATLRLMPSGQTQWLAQRAFSGADLLDVADTIVLCVLDHCEAVLSDREREEIKRRPTTVVAAYEELAKADRNQEEGRMFKALGCCRKAIGLDPQFALAHAKLGNIYMAQGQFDLGIPALEKALQIDPSLSDRSNLAVAYRKTGQAEEAFAQYAEVLRFRPHDPYIRVQLGMGHFYEKNYAQAENALNEALRLDPFVPDGHFSLGLVFRHSGRLGQAGAEFRKAVDDYPGDIQSYVMLSLVHQLLGDYEAAIKDLEDGLTISPDYGKAHNNMAALCTATRQFDKAWKHVREAQRLRYPVADVILDELRKHSIELKTD